MGNIFINVIDLEEKGDKKYEELKNNNKSPG